MQSITKLLNAGEKQMKRRVRANTKQIWGHGLQVLGTEFGEWWEHNGTASQVVQFPREPSSFLTPSTMSPNQILFYCSNQTIRSEFESESWVYYMSLLFFHFWLMYNQFKCLWSMNGHLCLCCIRMFFFLYCHSEPLWNWFWAFVI